MKQTIVRPHLTEKSLALAAKGWYAFVVASGARKREIASAITDLYKVTVREVRTASVHGKTRRAGRLMRTRRRKDWKKALVRLASGQTIEAFTTAGETEKK